MLTCSQTYLHRLSGPAGIINADFPVLANCGQKFSVRAPCHAKHLSVNNTKENQEIRRMKFDFNHALFGFLFRHLVLVSGEKFDLFSALQIPQSDGEII